MRIKVLAVFLVLTVALFGMGFYFLNRLSSEISPKAKPTANEDIRERLKSLKSKPAPEKQNASQPRVVYVTNQFRWSEIESDDYRKYIANLRAVGCPENTIKDIILTDVMKLYAELRGRLQHNGREFKFWETDEKRSRNAKQLEESEKQLAAIDKELPSVLRELLGVNYEREMKKYFVDTNEDERRLGFLPQEKRSQFLALREKYEGLREKVLEDANGNPSAADLEALKKIEEQRKAELEKILSEQELVQFDLAMSPTADRLRAELIGFNPSEAEFRMIFGWQSVLDGQFAFADANDEAALRQKLALQNQIQDEIKNRLGDARYAEYERAQNPDFRNTYAFTEAQELPASTAQTIFEIKQIVDAERKNLLANPALAERDRWEALRAMQVEIQEGLRQSLGTKALSNYSQGSGKWIWNLTGAN